VKNAAEKQWRRKSMWLQQCNINRNEKLIKYQAMKKSNVNINEMTISMA